MAHRYPQLDALRGLAAAGVVLNHAALIYASVAHPGGTLGRVLDLGLRIGNPLVVLFFVLSGFVLTLRPTGSYRRFVLRRIGRIYPAALATIAGVALASRLLPVRPEAWMGGFLATTLPMVGNAASVARAATLVFPLFADIRFDNPLWSLFHEMWFSLLMPPLAALLLVNRPAFVIGVLVAYAAAAMVLVRAGAYLPSQLFDVAWMNALLFLYYLPCFAIGMIAAEVLRRRERLPTIPAPVEWLSLAAFAVALDGKLPLLGVAASSLALLLCAIAAPIASWLTGLGPARFLGRISFSLYLVHLPVIAATTVWTRGSIPLAAALLVGGTLAVAAAIMLERLVERPAMQFTRRRLSAITARG